MTENERLTLKSVNGDVWLLDSEEKPYLLSVDGDDYNKALNRLAEYETIGTIEEFKALKNKHIGKDNMVISSSDLMTILNSDSEKEIRNKAIDDVFEFLKTKRDKKHLKVNFDDLEIRIYKEQLKGGAVDG